MGSVVICCRNPMVTLWSWICVEQFNITVYKWAARNPQPGAANVNSKKLKNDLMEMKLLAIIHTQPGRCKAQNCRAVNNHGSDELFCKYKSCYANAWKRKRGEHSPSDCTFRKPSVWRRIKNLEIQGLISINREKVKDRWMSRGWDWMKVCRPTIF